MPPDIDRMIWIAMALLLLVAALSTAVFLAQEPRTEDSETMAEKRRRMIREIEADTLDTAAYTGRRELDPRVLEAMDTVPRHELVPEEGRLGAYENRPLPIGAGQTISQPFVVALMTDLLEPESDHRVLEVGTGSGYQAAVLAELVAEVYTLEIVESLGERARRRLAELGYDNVHCRIGDGWAGWPEKAPFDGIIVTAAAPEVPPPLVEQLRVGGRMVIPLVTGAYGEELTVIEKLDGGELRRRGVLPVRFVPLTGDHGGG